MNLTTPEWLEVGFDVAYLIAIYWLVALMSRHLAHADDPQHLLRRFRDGFLALAVGDTGHVGFRVLTRFTGGLSEQVHLFGVPLSLVGLGSLATAVTVTFLYLVLLDVWRVRFGALNTTFFTLLGVGVVRLLLLVPEQNHWADTTPPYAWSLVRNAPLFALGVALGVLFWREGRHAHETWWQWLGGLVLLSYAFYLPVILFAAKVPALGALMVPKTIVYLVMAWLVVRRPALATHPA